MYPFKTSILRLSAIIICWLLLLCACGKKKKPSLSGDEKIEVADFVGSFPLVDLPFNLSDTSLQKKDKDSSLISKNVLLQFVPDSVLKKLLPKETKFKAYPLGRAVDDNGAHYLFLKTVAGDKKAAHLLAFNNKQKFIAALPLLKPDDNINTSQSGGVDNRFSIIRTVRQKKTDGSYFEGKDAYIFNEEARTFTLIMTDPLNEAVLELINPIDTMPRKHKYAADYAGEKMNLVAVRDGVKPDRISFFLHMEKNNGQCVGEIKGEAFWISSNVAEYKESDGSCILKLNFSSTAVSISEVNCGAKRNSIDCLFDGSFAKKKYTKPRSESTNITNKGKTAPKTVKK